MIPGSIEKNVGQPTLMRLRELVAAPVDWLLVAQKAIDQGKDRIEIFVIRAPAIRALGAPELLERIRCFSDAFTLDCEVYERPSRSVSPVPQAWDQRSVSVGVAKAILENVEDGGGGDVADAGMPDDIGDKIEDDGYFVRIEGPIKHPSDAKRIRDESFPVDFLFTEDKGYVLTKNYLHLFILLVGRGEYARLAFGGCSWLEVISAGLCRRESANGFPDTIGKAPTKDGQEGWSDRAGDNEDDTQDLNHGDSD